MSIQIYRRNSIVPGKALLVIGGGPKGDLSVYFEASEGATNAQVRTAALRALMAIYPDQPNSAQAMGLIGLVSLTIHTPIREQYVGPAFSTEQVPPSR